MKLGIDLGTYNSSAAVAMSKDNIIMVQSRYGASIYGKQFPSFVLFDAEGTKVSVGEPAKRELPFKEELVVWGVKRLVGVSFAEATRKSELTRFRYKVMEGDGGRIIIRVGPKSYRPEEILCLILEEIKADAENPRVNQIVGGARIDSAVITVPAYFMAWRTNPIVWAANEAGFTHVDTIAEPTAAAMRYGLQINASATILAFDMGAGTLDVTLLQILREGDDLIPGELCTSGNEAFGGIDIDTLLLSYLAARHRLPPGDLAAAGFRDQVEKAKIRLSSKPKVDLDLPNNDCITVTREELESALKPELDEKCRGPIRVALQGAARDAGEIDHVLFVGGPTHMPCVRRLVFDELKRLGARPDVLREIAAFDQQGLPLDPMNCVSQGASLKAASLLEPVTRTLAEGYGTLLGNRYASIVAPNSLLPVSEETSIMHGNVNARLVPVALVAKVPDTERSDRGGIEYRYTHLGLFHIAVNPTGDLPGINLAVSVDENKMARATLTHIQSGQRVRYHGLDLLDGFPIEPEEGPDESWSKDQMEKLIKDNSSGAPVAWTLPALESLIHRSRAVLEELASRVSAGGPDAELQRLRGEVERTIEKAGGTSNPHLCPALWNDAQALLAAMLAAKLIDGERYGQWKSQLDAIVGYM